MDPRKLDRETPNAISSLSFLSNTVMTVSDLLRYGSGITTNYQAMTVSDEQIRNNWRL